MAEHVPGAAPYERDDLVAAASAELERAAQADHEARLQVLEDLYRSLENQLDSAGSEALG